jgi:hypothetical protein
MKGSSGSTVSFKTSVGSTQNEDFPSIYGDNTSITGNKAFKKR